jgi:flagellar protein FliS
MSYATAKQAYTEAAVMTASPEQLVVMLYDGAVRFLVQSAAAMRAGQIAQARDRMRRAEAIVDELNLSLDMTQGEIPEQLRSIYLFCKRHLIQAGIDQNADAVEAVARMLSELRASWAEIVPIAAEAQPA